MKRAIYIGPPKNINIDTHTYRLMRQIFKIGEMYEIKRESSTNYYFRGFIYGYPKDSFELVNEYKIRYNLV